MSRSAADNMPRLIALSVVMFVAACASLPAHVPAGKAEFELQGRIAVRYGNDGGNVRISWRHAGAFDDLLVSNALGQGMARIDRNGDELRLVTADNVVHKARDAETLTESVLGWRLPLAGLPEWVRGRAVQGRAAQVLRDNAGRIAQIEQDAWRIQYLAWQDGLPSRITLTYGRDDGGAGTDGVEIRLIVDDWQVP